MMRNVKEALKFLISLVIMFSSIALILSIFTRTTVLNPNFYISSLEKSSYFTYLDQEIKYSFSNYSLITSIPAEVFSGSVSSVKIRNLTQDNIKNTIAYIKHEEEYANEKIDASSIDAAVKKYASGVKGDASQLSTVNEEAATIVNIHAVLFDVSAVEKYSQFQSLRNMLYIIYTKLYVLAAVLFMLIILLYLVSREKAGAFQLWLGGALLASSLVVLIPAAMGFIFNIPYRFAVENYYLKVALSSFALGYIKNLVICGALMLVAGTVTLYLGIRKVWKTETI
jgi:hypothetical protein